MESNELFSFIRYFYSNFRKTEYRKKHLKVKDPEEFLSEIFQELFTQKYEYIEHMEELFEFKEEISSYRDFLKLIYLIIIFSIRTNNYRFLYTLKLFYPYLEEDESIKTLLNLAKKISENDVFSLLFSDSHIFMPVKGRFSLMKNALFFGYTPILFEKGGGFTSIYRRFEQDNPRIKLYTDSCEAMMGVTERAIIDKVLAEAQYSDFPFEKWAKINILIEKARYLIFSPRMGLLRLRFELFINSKSLKSTDHPSAHRLKIDDFEIEVSKEDLEGLNIQTWGYLMNSEGYDYDMIKDYMYKKTRDPIWLD